MLIHDIALTLAPRIGTLTARKLIDIFGSSEAVLSADREELAERAQLKDSVAREPWNASMLLAQAQVELDFVERYGIRAIPVYADEYPPLLAECPDAPLVLYVKGSVDLHAGKWISIVGMRKASTYGQTTCENIVRDLAEKHPDTVIVSGLAYGIDIAAHKAAMKYGLPTVGVVAHGLDHVYPSRHTEYARDMIRCGGALITDFMAKSKIEVPNFIRRNRIIAGIGEATIVVESASRGGSLNTATVADSYNRPVFAVPGRINDDSSAGTNHLIKTQKAFLYQDVSDLEYQMLWGDDRQAKSVGAKQLSMFPQLSDEQKRILESISTNETSIDEILDTCFGGEKAAISALNLELMNLELAGAVKALPCRMYVRV